jgi:spartin
LYLDLSLSPMTSPEAFLLLSLSNASLATSTGTQNGVLQCVTIEQDVYLIVQMGSTEIPIDPTRTIHLTLSDSGARIYKFQPTVDSSEMVITVAPPKGTPDPVFLEDLESFESILAQYADLKGVPEIMGTAVPATTIAPGVDVSTVTDPNINVGGGSDLRGHLVLVNQDNGQVVGEFDQKIHVHEDPILSEKGHEQDPVVIEIPEDAALTGSAREVFARSIPPDQRGLMATSATLVRYAHCILFSIIHSNTYSHAISKSTNLLLTVITSASSYYISHSAPAPVRTPDGPPPPPPPRALVFLTSERTRKGLSNVHAFSGQAVKVSGKTISTIDKMIGRYIGGRPPKQKPSAGPSTLAAGPSSPLSPSPAPPPYAASLLPDGKPSLPPRRTPSPSPVSPRSPGPSQVPPPLPPRLGTRAHFVLSADLILSTLEESTKQFLDVSTTKLGEVIGHK